MSHDTCIPYSSSLLRHDSCVMRHDSWCTFGCSLCNRIVTWNYFSHVRKKALHRARGTGTFHMYVFMRAIQCLLWVSSSLVEIKVVTYVYHEPERIFLPEREAAKILLSFAHNHKITEESNTDFSFSIVCVVFHKNSPWCFTHMEVLTARRAAADWGAASAQAEAQPDDRRTSSSNARWCRRWCTWWSWRSCWWWSWLRKCFG